MKIIAISSEHSDIEAIALVTEPPLTPQVFQEFALRLRTPDLQPKLVSGCLVIRPERFLPELRAEFERILSDSEDSVSGVKARSQAEIEQAEKELTLASAAAGFGLPII